jgi:integrase
MLFRWHTQRWAREGSHHIPPGREKDFRIKKLPLTNWLTGMGKILEPRSPSRALKAIMKGASLKAVQELLGHADLSMTMRYSYLSQEHLKDSVNLLNDTPGISKKLENPSKIKKADNPQIANLL